MKPDYAPDEFILYVSPEVLYSVCFVLPPLVVSAITKRLQVIL